MWVKSTDQEAAISRRAERFHKLRIGVLLFCIAFLPIAVLVKTGIGIWFRGGSPLTWAEFLHMLPFLLVLSLVLTGFALAQFGPKRTMVCPNCEAVKSDDGNRQCSCGGYYESMTDMKWVDEVPK